MNPGSIEAIGAGCTCAVIDNHYGEGIGVDPKSGETIFWISADCPLHGLAEAR
jgi:hypothetical protein